MATSDTTRANRTPTSQQASQSSRSHYDSIACQNQQNSPLLRLPAELRNEIYFYVFNSATIQRVAIHGTVTFTLRRDKQLMLACTQIYNETKQNDIRPTKLLFLKGSFYKSFEHIASRKEYACIRTLSVPEDFVHYLVLGTTARVNPPHVSHSQREVLIQAFPVLDRVILMAGQNFEKWGYVDEMHVEFLRFAFRRINLPIEFA